MTFFSCSVMVSEVLSGIFLCKVSFKELFASFDFVNEFNIDVIGTFLCLVGMCKPVVVSG